MPDRWGGGKLLAFSGLDGPTSWAHTLVGSANVEPLGLWLHLGPDVLLRFGSQVNDVEARLVLGDAVELTADSTAGTGTVRFAFADCWTIVGCVSGALDVRTEGPTETEAGFVQLAVAPGDQGQRFCVALSPGSSQQALDRAQAGLELDLDELVAQRSAFIRDLDCSRLVGDADERTYRKCAEVLKLNLRAPEGQIRRRWTTPDVWPHRHMWLWDSAFHSLGWLELEPQVAQDSLLAVIEAQLPDGRIPHCEAPESFNSPYTQPPILTWATWRIYEVTRDRAFLQACYEPLCHFIEWLFRERDANGNGLLEWHKSMSDVSCRCGESGWDNSPRFDRPTIDDHIDLNSYVVCEMRRLAQMADVLGRRDEADQWRLMAEQHAARVNEHLWNDELGIYLDRSSDPGIAVDSQDGWVLLKTGADFLPMVAGIPDTEQAERLVAHLTSPGEFWAELPVPSVAMDEAEFSDDMWRGPTWLNINYLIWEGLKNYGFDYIADELRRRSMAAVEKWYYEAGTVFEFYDPYNETHPYWLHRKRIIGAEGNNQVRVIRDYGWTAACYISWARNR